MIPVLVGYDWYGKLGFLYSKLLLLSDSSLLLMKQIDKSKEAEETRVQGLFEGHGDNTYF